MGLLNPSWDRCFRTFKNQMNSPEGFQVLSGDLYPEGNSNFGLLDEIASLGRVGSFGVPVRAR